MISKLLVSVLFITLVSGQVPEQYPAGVDPAKCPNFPICDNAVLHNSQAVPRTSPLEPHQRQHYQQSQQQQHSPPRQQWVAAQAVQEQRVSVPVSHRNTQLPSYNQAPVQHSIPRPVQPSYPIQPSSHESASQWTLKNLHFDNDDYYQAPSSNYIQEPIVHTTQQPKYYEPQSQTQQYQYQHQHQYQQQQSQQQQYVPQQQSQQQQYVPQQQHYAPHPNHNEQQPSKGGDKYPAGVDAKSCPNYPYCGTNGSPHQAAQSAPPLPGFTERLYPAGVSPQQCANFPYCFE